MIRIFCRNDTYHSKSTISNKNRNTLKHKSCMKNKKKKIAIATASLLLIIFIIEIILVNFSLNKKTESSLISVDKNKTSQQQ